MSNPHNENSEVVQHASQRLEPKFRSVSVLRLIDGYSTKETAQILKIPEGTQNGDLFKISNKGMPHLHGRGYGDLYVQAQIKTPKRLSRNVKKLLEQLKGELGE